VANTQNSDLASGDLILDDVRSDSDKLAYIITDWPASTREIHQAVSCCNQIVDQSARGRGILSSNITINFKKLL
jgi:hypothetical protein